MLCNKNSYHSKSVYHDRDGLSTIYQDYENNENVDMSINTVKHSRYSSVVDVSANMQSQRVPLHDITTSNVISKVLIIECFYFIHSLVTSIFFVYQVRTQT